MANKDKDSECGAGLRDGRNEEDKATDGCFERSGIISEKRVNERAMLHQSVITLFRG